jgi:PAS domain-containing protein
MTLAPVESDCAPTSQVVTDLLIRQIALADRLAAVFGDPQEPVEAVVRRCAELMPEASVIVWEGDPQTFQFSFVSESAERILGYPCRDWLEQKDFWVRHIVHPADRSDAVAFCALATGKGADHDFRYRALAADGRVVELHDVVQVIKGARGVATRLRGIMIEAGAGEG